MARRKGQSASISGEQSPVQVKQDQKTEMQFPVLVKQGQKTDSNIDFIEEKLITKSDSIKSKGIITGSENQSINAGSEKKSADNTFANSENAARKLGNKPQNLTIKTEEEVSEKNCNEPSDNQLSQNDELAVSDDADNIEQSPKKNKKRKKKSRESFNDSLNDRNLELVGSPSMAACNKNGEQHKKKHKKKKVVNDNKVSSENNAEGNILPSVCNTEVTNFKLADEVMTVKGIGLSEGVDDTPEVRSEENTAKNEAPQKKKHKKRKVDKNRSANDCVLFSENNSEGNLNASVCNPNATTNLELATEVMTVSGIRLSGVDDTPDISLEANIVENEEPSKKKRKKRNMDKEGAGNEYELSSDNNLAGNLHPPICKPNATTIVELVTEVMTDSRVSLSKGVDNTFEIRSEANTVENEESSKRKRKKRKMDKKRAENENELVSENNLEGNLHPSYCNPNATSTVELVTEVMTDSGVGLSKGVDDTSEIGSEANIVENEKPSKKKHKKSKTDKKRVMIENELSSENNLEGNFHPSIYNSNVTTTEVMTDSVVNLSKGVGDSDSLEIRSEAITVKHEEPQKEKHKKRKKDKKRVANKSELLNENDSGGDIHPSDCHPNVTTNLELATEPMTVGENVLSNCVDDTSEIRSEANTVKNKDLQKKKCKKNKDKMSAANDNELLSKNNSEGKFSICNPNATHNIGLTAQTMTSDGISSSKAMDDTSEIGSESNTVNSEIQKKKKKSKRKMNSNSVASGSGILNNNLKENIPPLMEACVSNASVNCELADKSSGGASQSVNQQLTANETPSKGANNSSEINLVSNNLKSSHPHKRKERKKKEHKKMMMDDQDVRDKEGIEVKNIEMSQDNRLLRTTKNEVHTPRRFGRRKLLVLDLNGLLCEVIRGYPKTKKPYKRVNQSAVFKRPFCDDFLKFCHENFDIGVWSSRKMENVHGVVNVIMKDFRDDLLFCWSASECTYTRHQTLEDHRKPLVLKKLQKLWNKEAGNLPWELGDYSPSNTLLIDDSPYKAICNPPYTGVFPYPYNFNDENDNALGPGGELRVFLEGLALAEDVESYVREHPFGKPAITSANPSWSFYERIINYYK